ncbi:MAG: MBOAT family protein [Butyrivibrio sp.]|nr:MBOAT family O-acyltransferase [Butyrivibrio sp.]MBR1641508.1 MBOAT family protein [Butyrivibrio sp.]
MVFNSFGFILLFLPAFLLAMQLARRIAKKKPGYKEMCKIVIIAFSLVFYGLFGAKNCAVLAASLVVNALGDKVLNNVGVSDAHVLSSEELDGAEDRKNFRRFIFALMIIANLGSLLFFKFSGVFFPIAISFYTFNQISFIVDRYRGEIVEFNIIDYLAYILFFPKILQGPLMGYGDFTRELDKAEKYKLDYEVMLRALFLLSMGLFKKVILADTFGRAVDYGYDNLLTLGSLEVILVAVFYSFQLYFDFSGYCDMAGAVCMMIGFDLPDNFNSPYKAVNIVDFWKRWHISLTKFFTKYVYIPLGGNRKGAVRMYINFMIVFLLSGLWHGSGWTFIVWGAMHGVLYVVTRAVKHGQRTGKSASASGEQSIVGGKRIIHIVRRCISVALTFIYVTIAWVFFRANTITDAITLLTRVFTGGVKRVATGISACFQLDELWYVIKVTPIMKLPFAWETCLWLFLIVGGVIIFFSKNAITIARDCKIGVKTTLLTAFLLVWSIVSFAGVSTFLYMNF